MYQTRSGARISLSQAFFTWLSIATLLFWVGSGGLLVMFVALLTSAVGVDYGVGSAVVDAGWWLAAGSMVVFLPAVFAIYAMTLSVLDRTPPVAGPAPIYRAVFGSRWVWFSAACWLSTLVGASVIVAMAPDPRWLDVLFAGVTGSIAVWFALACTRDLRRMRRRASESPELLDGGVDRRYRGRAGDSSLWRSLGTDWVDPLSVVNADTALRYASIAEKRSSFLSVLGYCLPLPFVGFLVTSIVWATESSRSPASIAVPAILISVASASPLLTRRAASCQLLAGEYRERAKEITSRAPGRGSRVHRRRHSSRGRRPMVRI